MDCKKSLAVAVFASLPLWAAQAWSQHEPKGERAERMEEYLEEVKDEDPAFYKELKEGKREFRQAIGRRLGEMGPMLGNPEFRKTAFRAIKSEMKSRRLAEELRRETDAKKKEGLKSELRKALEESFDGKLVAHEQRLKHMEEEIVRLRERLAKRKKSKAEIIEKRLSEISGDEEGWEF